MAASAAIPAPPPDPHSLQDPARRRRLAREIWLVLGVAILGSATYAAIVLLDRYTLDVPLGDQTASINVQVDERPWLDLLYQLRRLFFLVVPALLALHLLAEHGRSAASRIGIDLARPPWRQIGRDLAHGTVLAAAVGIPGLGVYLLGRSLGLTVQISPASLAAVWWSALVLALAAVANSFLEEVVIVGYLGERLKEIGWRIPAIIAVAALLRGSYHLYQGPGMAAGNVAMGALFGWYYLASPWRGRVMPLIVAHALIDIVAFVGYQLLPDAWLASLGIG